MLIAGPTASGKSALATGLAQRFGGVVVNVDSMQVYRDLRTLSARPTPAEEARVAHRLYGHVDGAENYSVGRYVADATSLLSDCAASGRLPVLVGGTGLYFKALTEGLSELPPVPEAVRQEIRRVADGCAASQLHARLAEVDPRMAARLRPGDRLRVMRALEIQAATGRSLADFQGARQAGPLAGEGVLRLFLAPGREQVRAAIDARFLGMLADGGLDEVAALRERRLDPLLPIMRAHGVPGLMAHLDGTLSLEEAVARGQADTRAYAKRQMTWFRHQMAGWTAVEPEEAAALALHLMAVARPQAASDSGPR